MVPHILALCTANRCRSVMAEALLARSMASAGAVGVVRSAGMLRAGAAPPPEVVRVLTGYDCNVTQYLSREVCRAELAEAQLVLGMAREHVRYAVVMEPAAWPRTFTLKELIRLGDQAGPRMNCEPLDDWLARVHQGRERVALLGDSPEDDLADPIGGPLREYEMAAIQIDQLVGRLVELCWR